MLAIGNYLLKNMEFQDKLEEVNYAEEESSHEGMSTPDDEMDGECFDERVAKNNFSFCFLPLISYLIALTIHNGKSLFLFIIARKQAISK